MVACTNEQYPFKMRLLHTKTLRIHSFFEHDTPEYAILSHTWGYGEVTFDELGTLGVEQKAGWAKIRGCCDQALRDNLDYAWVDTCCIDKSSSAELSEAINSMYRWYAEARVCYAYLADVAATDDPWESTSRISRSCSDTVRFRQSIWFTRGWTLQELLAPKDMIFYSKEWQELGSKEDFAAIISIVTGIDAAILHRHDRADGAHLQSFSIAKRMSWAAKRVTTRVEDMAYCLMGIFNVNMALLYGEGKRAFIRLQEELMKDSDDETIFAWFAEKDKEPLVGLLATAPANFARAGDFVPIRDWSISVPHTITNKGLRIELPIFAIDVSIGGSRTAVYTALLKCTVNKKRRPLGIYLRRLTSDGDQFARISDKNPFEVPIPDALYSRPLTVFIRTSIVMPDMLHEFQRDSLVVIRSLPYDLKLINLHERGEQSTRQIPEEGAIRVPWHTLSTFHMEHRQFNGFKPQLHLWMREDLDRRAMVTGLERGTADGIRFQLTSGTSHNTAYTGAPPAPPEEKNRAELAFQIRNKRFILFAKLEETSLFSETMFAIDLEIQRADCEVEPFITKQREGALGVF